jgi:hypothetical protein
MRASSESMFCVVTWRNTRMKLTAMGSRAGNEVVVSYFGITLFTVTSTPHRVPDCFACISGYQMGRVPLMCLLLLTT